MPFPVFDFLQRRADLDPDAVAMVELANGSEVTYREMHQRCGRTAALLRASDVGNGDRVALLCRNRIEFFEVLFACARLGAVAVPLNWRMPATELAPLLADCGAVCLAYGAEDAPVAMCLQKDGLALLPFDDAGPRGFAARRDTWEPLAGSAEWRSDAPWYLLYTSGTTGRPKAVIQTFGMAVANYVNISQAMGLRREDTTLCFLPLFHTGGINLTALPALMLGGRVLVTPGFDLECTIELIATASLDTFFGVPAVYQAISLHPEFDRLELGKIRCWACGGAPLPDHLFCRFAERGAVVLNGMGMTETGPTVFLMDAPNARRKIGSVGKPQMLAAVRLVGLDGNDVAAGETGELWFGGLGVTPGYFNRPEETARALVDGRWLRSGDLARQDDEGYYYIVGRLKDMYISGGENVFPAEVENCLAGHPVILEAAVIGVPDERWGESGRAYLLLRSGHAHPSADELRLFLRRRLAAYKVPREFIVVDEFPRTAAGKIQKHLLPDPRGAAA